MIFNQKATTATVVGFVNPAEVANDELDDATSRCRTQWEEKKVAAEAKEGQQQHVGGAVDHVFWICPDSVWTEAGAINK